MAAFFYSAIDCNYIEYLYLSVIVLPIGVEAAWSSVLAPALLVGTLPGIAPPPMM
jgi:hypothetical protein